MKKILIIIGVGVALILAAVLIKKYSNKTAVEVSTEKAQKRTIIETVSANGKVQPEVEVKISPDVSGEIVELLVKEGEQVKKGDLLLKIEPDIYISAMERMNASLNTSKANLSNAKARLSQVKAQFVNTEAIFNRNKKLFDEGAISQSEFDAAKAAYESAKAEITGAEESVNAAEFGVRSAEASLKEANENLTKTTILAPVNGTISKLNVEKGERVVGTSQMAGTELLTIANLNEMEVSVNVNENDIVRVHLKDTAVIEVDAYLDRKFKGIVTEIANSANVTGITTDQVTNFPVKIRILQESYKDLLLSDQPHFSPFRPGMSATVDIQTKTAANVITVPIQAVTTRSESDNEETKQKEKREDKKEEEDITVKDEREEKEDGKEKNTDLFECVFIYDEVAEKVNMVKVKTGVQDNNYIEIKEGVKEGVEIASAPYSAVSKLLRDGMRVKKVDKEKLFNSTAK